MTPFVINALRGRHTHTDKHTDTLVTRKPKQFKEIKCTWVYGPYTPGLKILDFALGKNDPAGRSETFYHNTKIP